MNSTESFYVDADKVVGVQERMVSTPDILELSETFKLLGDPTRLKIILSLKQEELCVCDLASLLGVTSSAVSHQLRLLRNWRLVRFRRQGKTAYYTLDDPHISELIQAALEHVREERS